MPCFDPYVWQVFYIQEIGTDHFFDDKRAREEQAIRQSASEDSHDFQYKVRPRERKCVPVSEKKMKRACT